MALGRKPIEIVQDGKHQLLAKAEHWGRIFLKEIAKVQNGYAFSSSYFTKDEGMPLIRIRDIENENTVDKYNGKYSDEYLVRKGDVLIGMDGDFKASRWKGQDALLNQRVCRIIPTSETFDEQFLFFCLQPFLDAIHAETSSVTVKHLSSRTIEEIPLPFPPLSEQQEIVAKIEELFSELDKGKEQLETARQQLKVYRQAVLNSSIVGEPTNTIESVIESLDQGWSPKCHNEPSSDFNEWAVIKTTAIQSGYFLDKENKILPKQLIPRSQHELKEGDLLITRAGPRVRVGVCCMVKQTRPKLLNCDKVYRMRVKPNVAIPEYVELLLNSPKYTKEIELMKTGINDSGVNLTQKGFLKILIPIPSLTEQEQIVLEIESRLSVCDKVEETIAKSLQQAETLRQSILKMAFEGKLLSRMVEII